VAICNYLVFRQKAIELAIQAPNHKRTEPWRFYLLGPKAVENVCRLNADIITSSKGMEAGQAKFKRWMEIPGWLVVTCVTSDEDMNNPTSLAREDYTGCCCAVQNICLSLHSRGIGTKWTTGAVNFDERFAEAIGFDFNKEFTVGTICFGKAVGEPVVPVRKFEVDDVLKKVD
jgi:nitroreductase